MEPSQVIIRPVVSEKSYVLAEAGKYTFRVHDKAHKTQIRQAVELLFDVKVTDVRTELGQVQAETSGPDGRAHALVEEGDRPGASRRHDPDLPGVPESGGVGERADADSQTKANLNRDVASSPHPDFAELTRSKPEKSLVEGLTKSGGRNARGRKTARHRGGGAKRLMGRSTSSGSRTACRRRSPHIEYDPNRSAYIALLHYADGEKRYILAPARLQVGATVESGP